MILATNFQGTNWIDMVLPAWWIFDPTVSSWYRKFYCNNDLYCFSHFKLCRVSITIIHFFPVNSDLHTIIVKWLPCNKWFIQNQILQKYVSLEIEDILSWICIVILNIILHWQDWCIFFRKHEVIIVNIFRMHTSWQWFMIVHNNMSPLNIFGELYCKG